MATVWSGTDIRLGRPVAIKVLTRSASADPLMLRRLDEEARTLARLAHTNIVTVYDLGSQDDVPYVVMELVEGDDLRQRLQRGPMLPSDALRIAIQVCDALQAAHDAGIVHRDIKPDNVLLTRSGQVKVCDFGIARLQRANQTRATGDGTTIGTALYMAPEQATHGHVDPRTDLYALGCVLHEMLTGQPPFTGDDPMHVLWQHVHDTPAPVTSQRPDLPAGFDHVIEQLLAKNPDDRPARAADVRRQLQGLQEGRATGRVADAGTGELPMSRGRAQVMTRTQRVPRLEVDRDDPTPRAFRIGPAGTLAVALGTAIITALVITFTMLTTRPTQQAIQQPGGATSPTLSTVAPTSPPGTVEDVRSTIQAQVELGYLKSHDARDLLSRVDEIDHHLANEETDEAAQAIDKLRERIDELTRDHKITDGGRTAVLDSLDRLANSLPATADRGGEN
jgi:serine/threonine-protein kinase